MKTSLLFVMILLLGGISCNKDQYKTDPQISLESITTLIPIGGELDAKFKFTQKSSKLSGGTFIAIRTRLNQNPLLPGTGSSDSLGGIIPSYPDKDQGEYEFTMPYADIYEGDTENDNDTILIRFALIDRVGNKSDTISSPIIVLLSQ
jgi:hypothetical protein